MNLLEDIQIEKHKLLLKEKNNIWLKSSEWLKVAEVQFDGVLKNLLLSQIFLLRLSCKLEYNDAIKACEFFEKIPFEYYTEELIKDYIFSLKLCYKFDKAIELLKRVLDKPQCFDLEYYCLNELSDYSMVADGALTISEYEIYKKMAIELLEKEKERKK